VPEQSPSPSSEEKPPPTTPEEGKRRGPAPGCLIVPISGAFFILLICFAFYKGISLSKAIDEFTEPEPATLRSDPLPPDAATLLDNELKYFGDDLLAGRRSELRLNKHRINHLLATHEGLTELRGQFRVREITDGLIVADISYPLNNLPWKHGRRYLVGQLMLRPFVETDEHGGGRSTTHLAFQVMDIDVPGSEIPEWFRDHFSTYHLFERYEQDPAFQPYIRQLAGAEATNGELVLRALPLLRQ